MTKTIAVLRGSPRADSLTQKLARGIELAVGDRLTFRDIEIHALPLYNPDLENDAEAQRILKEASARVQKDAAERQAKPEAKNAAVFKPHLKEFQDLLNSMK